MIVAVQRHLDNLPALDARMPFITDGAHWAKLNQLKDYQEYSGGPGFSNNPPSDVFVGRDTFWFLVSSNYYAQAWSRGFLDFWFRVGQEPNGKFIEYMHAASSPLYRDDYGLNINDNTPLLMIAAHHYFSLSGDRGFLDAHYAALLRAANYVLDQRNTDGLVWCRSRDAFVRGLSGWRNCTWNYRLSGAVTEINSECYRALALMAELAAATGDRANATRLNAAANDLHTAINRHLQSTTAQNPFYLLMIDPDEKRADDLTGDLLFPALFGVAPRGQGPRAAHGIVRRALLARLTHRRRRHAHDQRRAKGFYPQSRSRHLWTARRRLAESRALGRPRRLRRRTARPHREGAPQHARCSPTAPTSTRSTSRPASFPEYFNGDDLLQRGAPRSTFIHGSYLSGRVGSACSGSRRTPTGWRVNPVFARRLELGGALATPFPWRPAHAARCPAQDADALHDCPCENQMEAGRGLRRNARWRNTRLESDAPVFWLVTGKEVLAASDTAADRPAD